MRKAFVGVRALMLAGISFGSGVASAKPKIQNFEVDFQAGELIVKFSPELESSVVEAILAKQGAKIIRNFRASGAAHVILNNVKSLEATKAAAVALAGMPEVQYVEANNIIHLENTPDDPRLGELWGMQKISAESAWERSTGSRNILVGVIDTGIDYTHPDLAANYWRNSGETGIDGNGKDKSTNGIDDDGNGYIDDFRGWDFANNDNDPMDDHYHGTHCAGTIGASGNNGQGVAGVNWEVSFVGLKFITASGNGTNAGAIAAIEYATKIGVDLTSNSWGGGAPSQALEAAIREASNAGIFFVAAAGNSTANNDNLPNYPSNYDIPNVIAVAATDQSDRLASFSSYGRTSVDLAAPGVGIISTVLTGGFRALSGTSMATPHVAGAVALMKAVHTEMTMAALKQKLLSSVDPVAALAGKVATGGRLNLEKALQD